MSSLPPTELSASSIDADKSKLVTVRQRIADMERQLSQLQGELEEARAQEASLASGVQWRELMAAVDADASVCAVSDRLTETFTAFRDSLVEPENYAQMQREEAKSDEDVVPFSDTDDYADFSAVEGAVEDLLAVVRQSLETHAADPFVRPSTLSSLTGSFAQRSKTVRDNANGESAEQRAVFAAERHRALLQLLVVTVLMGKVEEHCTFAAIPDPSGAPSTDAEELRDGVAAVWQWLLHEQPTVLTAGERAEWLQIASTYLGEAYAGAP